MKKSRFAYGRDWYKDYCEISSEKYTWVKFICWYISESINRQICRRFGHKWNVTTYAGPDSGEDYFVCTRCGKEHTIVYY